VAGGGRLWVKRASDLLESGITQKKGRMIAGDLTMTAKQVEGVRQILYGI
jgi:hypothetical protein